MTPSASPRRLLPGAAAGLLAAAVAIGTAELAAALISGSISPVVAVGGFAIDATPEWLKHFAITHFGSNDKTVLLSGIFAGLAVFALVVGVVAVRNLRAGVAGVLLFGAIGLGATLTRPQTSLLDAAPSVLGALCGAGALVLLIRRLTSRGTAPAAVATPVLATAGAAGSGSGSAPVQPGTPAAERWRELVTSGDRKGGGYDRRGFLLTGVALGGVAAATGTGGRSLLARRMDVSASRGSVKVPVPASKAAALPAGAELKVPQLPAFYTKNRDFYRVDVNLVVPKVATKDWKLRIHGKVDKEINLTFDDLLKRRMIERDITLTCVSNEVGGPYVGTARWIGTPLRDLLREAGVRPGADQLVSKAVDGFTIGTPTRIAMDGRDAMLAVAMNGEPLPVEHGFPVRMLIPGLYGYVSATKWVVDLELTTYAAYDAYWTKRKWSRNGPIKTMSRIDTPRPLARVKGGKVAVAGVAWAQHRGIDKVEVRVDGGAWKAARLATQANLDTWRQWVYEWDAAPGQHTLEVRATDRSGSPQTNRRVAPFPDGATGWHSVVVTVT